MLSLCGAWRLADRFESGTLRVLFFDVGQGDAALVRFPRGQVWLVDAGGGWGEWDRGQRDLFLELSRFGILTIDVAILSHPDVDHGLGFRGLWRHLQINHFWWNGTFRPLDHPLLRVLVPLAHLQGTLTTPWVRRSSMKVDGVKVTVLPVQAGDSKNECPLAVWLEWEGCHVLLGGDAEARAEANLVRTLNSQVDILKVHHHGSRTSSSQELVESLRPRWAVASLGKDNHYGHPHPEVVDRFRRQRVPFLRTDEVGFVEFTVSPGGHLHCQTAKGSCGDAVCDR